MTTVRYGSALTSSPEPPWPRAAGCGATSAVTAGRDGRTASTGRPAARTRRGRPRPARWPRPTPLSQCMPSGTPNRSRVSSVFGVPPTVGDRNSRYMTDRNGHWSSSGAMPANMLVPSRLYSADISRCSRSGCLPYRWRSASSCGASRAWTACPRRARRLSGMSRSRTAIVNAMIAATAASPPRTGVRTPVSPETRWYAASTGTPRKLNMRQRPSSYDGMRAGGGREVRGSSARGGRPPGPPMVLWAWAGPPRRDRAGARTPRARISPAAPRRGGSSGARRSCGKGWPPR